MLSDKTAVTGRAVSKLQAGAPIAAIVPQTIEEVFRLAELVYQSGLAPYQLKSPQAVTVVFLKGLEIGLPPMAALESIGVINGRACLYGDGIPALLWSHGFKIRETYKNADKLDACIARCEITRPDGEMYEFEYSAQDAKDNGLWDTREKIDGKPNKSPWFVYKKRMIRMRCRGWLARDCAADVLKGIPIYEEQADIELGRQEYREVNAPLPVPDIPDEPAADINQDQLPLEMNQDAPEPLPNPKAYLAHLEEEMSVATTADVLSEIWESHTQASDGRLSREHQEAAEALHEKHEKRLSKNKKGA